MLSDQPVAMEKAEDVELVFEALRQVSRRSFFTKERAQRDVAEELGYQLLVHPDWIRPHVAELVRAGGTAEMRFDSLCLLLDGAPDSFVSELIGASRRASDPTTLQLLLATRAPAAMEAVAMLASGDPAVARECRDLGFHLPPTGPAEPRFTVGRHAVRVLPGTAALGAAHAVGLPLAEVVAPHEHRIAFHHLSVTPGLVPEMPEWAGRAHVVAPRHWPDWTLRARTLEGSRVEVVDIELDDDRSLDTDLADLLDEVADGASAAVAITPFDDELLYVNQHSLSTPDVIGVVGGPPMGLAPAPVCPDCDRLMFHVGYVDTAARPFGDGFRSLFVCEDCRTSATVATLWN